jgi:TnpA family transposase
MAKTIAELQSLSDDELVEQHDKLSESTAVGIDYYLGELERRRMDRQSRQMLRLTLIVTALTVVNVAAVIVSLV